MQRLLDKLSELLRRGPAAPGQNATTNTRTYTEDRALSEITTAAPGLAIAAGGMRFGICPSSHGSAVLMVAFDSAPGSDSEWKVLTPGQTYARPDGRPFKKVFVRRVSTTPSSTNRVRFDVDPDYLGSSIGYASRAPAISATGGALETLLKVFRASDGAEGFVEGADGTAADRGLPGIAGWTGAAYVRLAASAAGRLLVNLIAGQDGISAGAGAVGATTPRMTLASDDPAVASLSVLDDWDDTDRCKVSPIAGQAGVAGGVGDAGATTVRTVEATVPTAVASQFAVGAASAVAVAANANRKSVVLVNEGANTATINFGAAAVAATHFGLLAGASIRIESRQSIEAISAAGTTLHIVEESK